MATLQPVQGQTNKQLGAVSNASCGEFQELLVTELQPRLYQQNYRGQTFCLSAASQTPTAFVGAAGGTPLLAIWNPANTGKNLVLIQAGIGVVAAASAAGLTQFRIYAGATAAITQATTTVPRNLASLAQNGSIATGFVDVALTSSTAMNYLLTMGNYYWGASGGDASFLSQPNTYNADGCIIVPPAAALAIGAVTIPTSMTNDAWLIWSEVSI